jgi:serine/threonine-protein kinase
LANAAAPNEVALTGLALRRRPSRLRAAALVFVVIASAAALLATIRTRRSAAASSAPSLAVLPLTNVGRAAADAPLVDGLTEELTTMIARIAGLRVVGRTSAFGFKDSKLGTKRIADSLRVQYVLEGGAQFVGERIRVQARLVDARDGSAKWSETYDKQLGDVFQVQRDIAAGIAHKPGLTLAGNTGAQMARPPTSNVVAHELVLRGNDPAMVRSDSAALVAVAWFRRAVALDSNCAAAYAGLARMQVRSLAASDPRVRASRLTEAEVAATKAIRLDPARGGIRCTALR